MFKNSFIDMDMDYTPEQSEDLARKYSFTTWVPQKFGGGLVLDRGEGCYLYDLEGKKYFDLSSGSIVTNIGHQNEKVIGAVREQLEHFTTTAPAHVTNVRSALSKKIIEELCPDNMARVLYTMSGADANEYAIRLAKKYTGKPKIFSQYRSYHGSTYGATNLNGERMRATPDPAIASFVKFFGCNWQNHGLTFKSEEEHGDFLYNMLREQILDEDPNTVAAIFFESITGSNGAIVPPSNYYKQVRAMCDEFGIIMVCDEVMVGFGRTGKLFAFEHFGIKPDIITCAKGLTSGYITMGATILCDKISEFYEEEEFPCGLTYTHHPAACAAALANIEVIQQEKLCDNAAKMGEYLWKRMEKLQIDHPCIKDIEGKGLFTAFNLNDNYLIDKNDSDATTWGLIDLMEKNGLLTFSGRYGYVMVAPPLIVTEPELDDALNTLDKCLTMFEEQFK